MDTYIERKSYTTNKTMDVDMVENVSLLEPKGNFHNGMQSDIL